MYNDGRNILLIVEGADDEVNLFKKIIQCFPEISLSPDNVLVYNTNLWVLNEDLEKEFGMNWYESEDIDFRIFCESRFPQIKGVKITDTFLVFDYERQDPKFDPAQLENLCRFFNDSVENAKELIDLFKGLEVKINLIPFNWWEGSPFEAPSNNAVHRFAKVLEDAYLAAPIRTPRGQDIMAACGQLKSAYKNNKA